MKNSDKPAHPVRYDPKLHWDDSNQNVKTTKLDGLTKREAFAMAAMQGLCANGRFYSELSQLHDEGLDIDQQMARSSIDLADALLRELEATDETSS